MLLLAGCLALLSLGKSINPVMKHFSVWMLLLALFVSANKLEAQQATAYFHLDAMPVDEWDHLPFNDSLKWFVNSTPLFPGDSAKKIGVYWPGFDTVVVKDKDRPDRVILTRFSPDTNYYFSPYGCCHDLDFYGGTHFTSAQKYFIDSLFSLPGPHFFKHELDSIHINHIERGIVKFKVVNRKKGDTLAGTFGYEHITLTTGIVIKGDTFNTSGRPLLFPLGSGYCFDIRMGKASNYTNVDFDFETGPVNFNTADKEIYALTKEYFRIEYRFLRPETLYITLDAKTGKVSMIVKSP